MALNINTAVPYKELYTNFNYKLIRYLDQVCVIIVKKSADKLHHFIVIHGLLFI